MPLPGDRRASPAEPPSAGPGRTVATSDPDRRTPAICRWAKRAAAVALRLLVAARLRVGARPECHSQDKRPSRREPGPRRAPVATLPVE